jgi:tripartite-type tricarboxylate transporter receptor subunit TctC
LARSCGAHGHSLSGRRLDRRAVSHSRRTAQGQDRSVVRYENKPGASGNIGIDQIAKGAADGYAIGGATVGHFSINQFLIAKMPFDAEKDLVAPSLVYELPNVAVVAAQRVPAKTLQEFIAWA